jgi:hypothetical protein
MALCLAQSLFENGGLEVHDVLTRFCDWAEKGSNTSTGVAVGIGQNTLRVLGDFRRNGYAFYMLMWTALALWHLRNLEPLMLHVVPRSAVRC